MSILYCATELGDGYGSQASADTSGAVYYDADWVDQGILVPDEKYWGFGFPTTKDIWIAFDYRWNVSSANFNADGYGLWIMTDTGKFVTRMRAIDGLMRYEYYLDGTTALSGGPVWGDTAGCLVRVDYHIEYDVASSGTVTITMYIDGAVRGKTTAATLSNVDAGIASLRVGNIDMEGGSTVSSFIVADEDTRGMKVTELEPDGAGNYTAWDGDYSDLGAAAQGSGISSNVNGDRESWTLDAFTGPAGAVGMRVVNAVWAYPGASGVSQVDSFLRISSTDYDSGALTPTPANPLMFEWTVNPATSAVWDTTAIGLLEAGVEAVT